MKATAICKVDVDVRFREGPGFGLQLEANGITKEYVMAPAEWTTLFYVMKAVLKGWIGNQYVNDIGVVNRNGAATLILDAGDFTFQIPIDEDFLNNLLLQMDEKAGLMMGDDE